MKNTRKFNNEEPIAPKKLYRYLNQKYIDLFFSTGSIFLTSYVRCRAHEDATRRDGREGKYHFGFHGENNSLYLNQTSGDSSYMLCTSYSSEERLLRHFDVEDYFIINDPVRFSNAIKEKIPDLINAQMGPCRYVWGRNANKSMPERNFMPDISKIFDPTTRKIKENLTDNWKIMHQEHAEKLQSMISDIGYFAKPLSYANEMEFRMIWTTKNPATEGLVIFCPEAVKYCERR